MSHEPIVSLYDAVSACNLIIEFSNEITLQEYKKNLLVKSAIERQFEILGEALNRIKKNRPEILHEVTDWNRIVAFRNIIAHGYDAIDDEIVFVVIKSKIPLLLAELLKITKSENSLTNRLKSISSTEFNAVRTYSHNIYLQASLGIVKIVFKKPSPFMVISPR